MGGEGEGRGGGEGMGGKEGRRGIEGEVMGGEEEGRDRERIMEMMGEGKRGENGRLRG